MSEITLLIRRRSIAAGKKRVHHINKLLSFLELNKVPVPCSPGVPREPGSSQPRAAGTAATDKECQKRAATMNTFMHMKSLIDAVHIQIDDVIQLLRTMFTPVLYSRLSPGFISNNEHEYRNQATKFRETDEEIADLYASLLHPFEVWQGTFRNRQREEFLEINMRLQCPFRPPKQTQHRKELVSGSTIELIQGFLPFGYKDAEKVILENRAAQRKEQTILLFTGLFLLQVAARGDDFASSLVKFILNEQAFEVALKHTTWPLLDFLQHQSILISSEPSVISSLQCNALESLRWGLRKLGLGNEAVTVQPVQQVLQTMLNDANFSEVASFLPPPVEAVDSVAFPLGFLHIQSTMLLYSILVTPSGDALFGNIPEFPSTPSAGSQDNRTLVTLKKGNGSLLLEDPVSKQTFKFEDPRGCNPGSQQSVKFLRYLWRTIWNSLKSGYFPQSNSDPWFARAKKYVDDVIKQNKFDALCEDQKDILVEELLKAMSHNTPLHEGATVWNGSSLVVLDRIRDGVSYVRPAGPLGTKAKQVATTDTLFHSKKLHVGDEVQVAVSGNRVKYVLLYLAPISRTGCVSKLRRLDSGEIILWREPLIRVHGFEMGELVRKALSIEVYQYLGTCGHYYKLKNFVTGLVEWTTEDLLPLWAPIYHDDLGTTQSELANVYPPKELHMNLIVFLREFSRTKESRISLSDFRKVLRLLISHNLLTDDQAKALQHTFDKREKKDEFDKTVLSVKQLASRLLSALRKTLISNCSAAEEKQWLFVWGNATVAALEAMWRTRHLWRTLHKIHREGLNQFFTEVSNVPQIPDLTKAMKDKSFNMERVKKKGRDIIVQHTSASRNPSSLPSLCQAMPKASDQRDAHLCLFVNFVAESVTPKDDLKKLLSSTKKEETLKLWDDYCTAVEDRLKDFASQQKAMQNICEKLRKKDSAFPQSSPVSSWADAVLLRVSETIGSIMKDSLGTKVSSSAIESALKPVILQELVEVSGLSFDNKSDIERLFGNLSEYLATEISKTYQIQNPGRVPRGDVLLNVLSLLEVEEHDVKQLEKQIRHQYSQLTQKYVDQLVSDELINTDGVLDMIGALEKALASLVTPVVDRALGLVKKAARFFLKPKRRIRHFLFGFNKMAEFLDKTVAEEPPTDTDIESLEFVIENETLDDTTPPQKPMGTIKRSVGRFLMKGALGTSSAALYVLHSFNVTFAHHLRHIPHIFWTPIVRGALEIGIKAALSIFVGPDAKQYIKLVQDSIWISGIQPWFESLKLQCDILGKLLKGIQEGQNLSHNWWRELPLLVFIKQSLDDARLSLFDPSNLYTIWSQIKYATSSSSSLFKVLMTPVKDLGVYLYLLLVKLLDGVLPSENGDFLVPREPYEEEQNNNPVMDIAVANPPDLIKYLHRLFDVILKVYVPMVRKLFDNIIQLVLQKVAYRSKNDRSLLELWRIINHIAGYDVDFEIENIFRETFSGVIDSLFQRWPTLPVGSPLTWQ